MEETERFLIGTREQKLFGAFAESILVGIVRNSRYSGSNEGHRAYIAGLYVDPDHRGNGVGRALLENAINESKKDPTIRRINLTVVSDQSIAIRLYQSLGFVECGIGHEAFSARGQFFDEICMTKKIEPSCAGKG